MMADTPGEEANQAEMEAHLGDLIKTSDSCNPGTDQYDTFDNTKREKVQEVLRKAFEKLLEVNKCQAVWSALTSKPTWSKDTFGMKNWRLMKKCEKFDHFEPNEGYLQY